MRILALGTNHQLIESNFAGHDVFRTENKLELDEIARLKPDIMVSFGYRHILKREALEYVNWRAVNLHISLLPWGRGADPNLWSWLEHTPKGVSLHWIDEGLDSGDLVAQREVALDHTLNLAQTYKILQEKLAQLFADCWEPLASGSAPRIPQPAIAGSYHRAADKLDHLAAIPQGWQTPCSSVEAYGRLHGLCVCQ